MQLILITKFNATTVAKLWCLASLAFLPATGATLDWTVSVLPSADLIGSPGSAVQWNYHINNLSDTDSLVLSNLNAGVFQHGTPLSIFDFPIIAPLDSASGGLYQFTLDAIAPNGFMNSGAFVLSADFYVGDPTGDGTFDTSAPDKSLDYSVTAANATVPEPGTATLIFAIAPILVWRLRAKVRAARSRHAAQCRY